MSLTGAMPPKAKSPARSPVAKSGAQSPARKGSPLSQRPGTSRADPAAVLKALKELAQERAQQEGGNRLLQRLQARAARIPRVKKVRKFSKAELQAAENAAVKIQSWVRMLNVFLPTRRSRTAVVAEIRQHVNRGVTEAAHSPERLQENIVLRQLPAHRTVVALASKVKTAEYQLAALTLQAFIRARPHRRTALRVREAFMLFAPWIQAMRPRLEWGLHQVQVVLSKVHVRAVCQKRFRERRDAISLVQALCRKCVRERVSYHNRMKHQATFKRAYLNHKMSMMRDIWVRRDAIIEIQSQVRRAIDQGDYAEKIWMAREANKVRRSRRECGILLSSRCRMIRLHSELHRHVEKYNLLRRLVRSRIDEEKYHEKWSAALTLQSHCRACAVQLTASVALRMPLARHTERYPDAVRLATVLQAVCRRWCMESMGQHSMLETHPMTGKGRLLLCLDQTRDAAIELQLNARRLLASSADERLEPRGYASWLMATELLHAQIRRVRVRDLIRNLMDMYGVMTVQAVIRRNRSKKTYGIELTSCTTLVYALRRSLMARWYARAFGDDESAQRKLQAFCKLQTTPPPDLKYSQMPTRELAKVMQAQCRGALSRRELVKNWDAVLTVQTIVRMRLRRMLYIQAKIWCKKTTAGTAPDIHKFFYSLTSTKNSGTHMWRTAQYENTKKIRGPLWKTADFDATIGTKVDPESVKAVQAVKYVVTQALRCKKEAEQIQSTLQNRVQIDSERHKNGLLLDLQIPSGSRRILNQGRIVQVLSLNQFAIDPVTSSQIEDEYRYFFFETGGHQRRIVKYTQDHVVTVLPPFESRPVVNTMYYVIDTEPTPIEPNLVKIRRERQRKAACVLQYLCRYYTAKKEFLEKKFEAEINRQKQEAFALIEGAYENELEEARKKVQYKQDQVRDKAREGRRKLLEMQARQEAKQRAESEAKEKQLERLHALTPKIPVAPARLLNETGSSTSSVYAPSPRQRQVKKISVSSYSRLMGEASTQDPKMVFEDPVRDELERRVAFENSQLEICLEKSRIISLNGSSMLENSLGVYSVHEGEAPQSPGSNVSDADSEFVPLISAGQVRRHVRKVNHALHVDRSPPKIDQETSEALKELEEQVSLGAISRQEADSKKRKLRERWKQAPTTSPRDRLTNKHCFQV